MTLHQSNRLTVTCNDCSTVNDLLVLSVGDHQEVACSRCGTPLGRLGELKNKGTPNAGKPHQNAASISQ